MSSSKISKFGLIFGLLISISIFTLLYTAYLFSSGLAKTALKVELENRIAANESLTLLLQDEKFADFFTTEKLRLERIAQLQILVRAKDFARAEHLLKNNAILLGDAGEDLAELLQKLKNQRPFMVQQQPTPAHDVDTEVDVDNIDENEMIEEQTQQAESPDFSAELIQEFDAYCKQYVLAAMKFELSGNEALAYKIGLKLAKSLNFNLPQ